MRTLLNRLKIETFVLYLDKTISEAPNCGEYPIRMIDSNTIEADLTETQSLNDLYSKLSLCGIHVMSMRNKTNRLEQLFISMLNNGNAA